MPARVKARLRLVALAVMATCVCISGCADNKISRHRSDYKHWIATNYPDLVALPKRAIHDIDYSTLSDRSGNSRPIIDYYLKAGDWDGLVNVTVVIEIDASGKPLGLHEERCTFIAFPPSAPYTAPSYGSKLRHDYKGLVLPVADIPTMTARVAADEDFDDLRYRSLREGRNVLSCFVSTDSRKNLRR